MTDFTFSAYGKELFTALGVDIGDFVAVGITVAVVFIISLLSEKGVDIRSALREKHPALHYAAILALIIYIVILGAYGPGYTPVDPIYADFEESVMKITAKNIFHSAAFIVALAALLLITSVMVKPRSMSQGNVLDDPLIGGIMSEKRIR